MNDTAFTACTVASRLSNRTVTSSARTMGPRVAGAEAAVAAPAERAVAEVATVAPEEEGARVFILPLSPEPRRDPESAARMWQATR